MEPAAMRIPHMKPALYRAAAAGTLEDYRKALRVEGAEDCQVAPNGNTVLHVAVLHGNKHFVEQILEQQKAIVVASSSMLFARNNKNETVLHCAAEKGDADIVSALIKAIKEYNEDLESGVGVIEMIHMTDDVKDMALHKAVRMGHLEVVKLLIEEDNGFLYPTNEFGETPIYLAAESHFLNCLEEILETCQNLSYVGPLGRNALHAAILSSGSASSFWEMLMQIFRRHVGKAGCIQLLLDKETYLCEMSDSLGWTPLHYAVKHGDDQTVQKILEKKSSAAYIRAGKEDDWTTIFHIAARHGNIKTMKCISNSLPDCWVMINCKSQNVLHEAILSGRENMIKYILKYPQIDNLVDQKDKDGNTPQHLFGISSLSIYNHYSIVSRLKRKHLVFNKHHQTLLDVASQREVYSVFKHISGGLPQRSGWRIGPRADLIQNQETREEDTDNVDKEINDMLRVSKTMTLVATLILTISFAAGFTVPGGYDSKNGYPILIGNKGFSYFVISDTVAFICSILAILIYMFMVAIALLGSIRRKPILIRLFILNTFMTFVATIAVVYAFLGGMYTILATYNMFLAGSVPLIVFSMVLLLAFLYYSMKNTFFLISTSSLIFFLFLELSSGFLHYFYNSKTTK
ncbi:PREDICTED: ankyrin repeat-containing protein ITN1-like [Ipomoea nil]|uniref:ankyrin repeat-containing protein ITN1-like n=1 Tax=Ipomoea nil TaxID=35883 RepID=UPI0009020159|nr:PREDICTED: ankyrin repeat-containing protein ITN1-like [Ipomoea nil]